MVKSGQSIIHAAHGVCALQSSSFGIELIAYNNLKL